MKTDNYPASDLVERCDYRKYKPKTYQILREWHKTVQNAAGTNQNVLFDLTEENLSVNFFKFSRSASWYLRIFF